MKKYILAFAMFLVLPFSASAVVVPVTHIDKILVNGGTSATVAPGDTVTLTVVVDREGTSNANDWESTDFDILPDGLPNVCSNNPSLTTGTGLATTTYTIVATTTPGTYNVQIKTFHDNNCADQFDTTKTLTGAVKVQVPPTPTPTPTVEKHRSSGGVFVCDIAHGNKHWVMEKDEKGVEYRACRPIGTTPVAGSTLQPAWFYANALGGGADYSFGTSLQHLWDTNEAFRNALLWMYQNR